MPSAHLSPNCWPKRKPVRNKVVLVAALLLAHTAFATTIEQPLPNAAQEKTARAIFHELKCVVCEGQSLADSNATLAVQMRDHVRRLLRDGKNEQQVLSEFQKSYGDKILLTPPVEPTTYLLWLAPLLLLGIGSIIVVRSTRTTNDEK